MKEIDIKKKTKKAIIVWSLLSVLGVVAIPVMIVALVNGNWFIAIPGIATVAFCFYGLPIGWVFTADLISQRNLAIAIIDDGITDINELAAAYNQKAKRMANRVSKLISKRHLPGYKLNAERTKIIASEKPVPKKQTRCEACGAYITPDTKFCEYCGAGLGR